jgi:putative glutathione S-transferase
VEGIMGLLVDGKWQDQWYDTKSTGGRFVRQQSAFRNWVTRDGSPGPSGVGGFKAEPGRYHLYVSFACPWAHRTLIFRKLKGLTDMINFSVVHWLMGENGWTFMDGPGVIPDPLYRARFLYEIYAPRVAALKGFGNAVDQRAARSFVATCMEFLVPGLIIAGTTLAAIAATGFEPGAG